MRFPLPCHLTILALLFATNTHAQHYYYLPNSVHLPAFQQRHDASIGIGLSRGTGAEAFEIQADYSPVKGVGIIASYMNAGDKEVLRNTLEGFKYRFYEIGAGLYETIPRATFSLLGGFGSGNIYNYYQGDEFADLDIRRGFIQPSFLYHDDFFQGGICMRLSRVYYNKGKIAVAIPPQDLEAIRTIERKSPFFLPEIGISGGMKLGPILLSIKVCGIFPRTDNLAFARINSSVFLSAELGKLFKGKKKASQ